MVYVLVHGAWHGSWCWKKTAALLEKNGHTVYTPTLTGLGERSHLASPNIDLEVHIQDILGVLECNNLSNVVLVGHSYAGMLLQSIAERAKTRLSSLIYLDAFIPDNKQSLFDLLGLELTDSCYKSAAQEGDGWLVPPFPPEVFGLLKPEDAAWVQPKLVPHPFRTFFQTAVLKETQIDLPCAYIYCSNPNMGPFDQFIKKSQEKGMQYRVLETGHDAMVTAPEELAKMLVELGEGKSQL